MSGFFPDAARSGAGVTEGNVRQWDSAAPTVKDLGVGDGVENRCWARVSDVLVAVARGGEEEPELEQELRCLNVNELSDVSRSCNLWTSATITANYSERQNLEERKRNAERWHTACVCVCALMTEGGGGGRDWNIMQQASFMVPDSSGHRGTLSTSIVLTVTSLCRMTSIWVIWGAVV